MKEIKIIVNINGFEVLYNDTIIKSVKRINKNTVQPCGEMTDIIENVNIPNYLALMLEDLESSFQEVQDYIYNKEVLKEDYLVNPDVSDFYIDDTQY